MEPTRRRVLAGMPIAAGTLMAGSQNANAGQSDPTGQVDASGIPNVPKGLYDAMQFPLIDAVQGRRSRRFAKGASIPAGPLAYTSKHQPEPLSELQQMVVLTTIAGNTGWSNLIPFNQHYLPHIPNYAGAAGGRTFPSAAGFHTTTVFYTDDNGTYFFDTKNAPATEARSSSGVLDLADYLNEHRARITKLGGTRLKIPAQPQHMEMHNTWCANVSGSTLVFPVADLAQHQLLGLCYLVQNGAVLFDDINGRAIPGMEDFKDRVDPEAVFPLSYFDQSSLMEVTTEMASACYAGALMLQALGLGGWLYQGINPFSVLGASGDPEVPGLGFRFDVDSRWSLPNVTGLPGVFEGHCPPHFKTMRAAVEAVVERKFGTGGPFNAGTPGPYKESDAIRGSGAPIDDRFIACVTHMADYIYETFGKFPATIPSVHAFLYCQAHKLDTGFYDTYFEPGAYLSTHRDHDRNWKA